MCEPHVNVHHDYSQTSDRAKFALVPTATPPATYACTLSNQMTVVLGSISRTPLVIIRGTLTDQRCVDDIMRIVLLSFLFQYLCLILQKMRTDHMRHMLPRNVLQLVKHFLGQTARSLFNRACLGYDGRQLHLPGNVDDLAQ
ncbi:hypothetical protein TNCV_3321731 [Trichonephila clavipes]|nr:hypothetical protein TNCV_3321731 [Trichonephila clavipes]